MAIRVVFLTFYYEAWDALDGIYREMVEDPRFEPIVVSIPRRMNGETEFGHEEEVSHFLNEVEVPHLRFFYQDGEEGLTRLKDLQPDYVFLNYPWRRNYQPAYRAERLIEFTKICYVPYFSMPLVNEPGEIGVAPHLYEQRTHQLASLVFTMDRAVLDAYAHTDRGNGYVHLTGSPKIDVLMKQAREGMAVWPIPDLSDRPRQLAEGRRFRMIWAPHHSHDGKWLNFGMFAEMHKEMLRFATMQRGVEIVLRPHPLLFGTLVERGLICATELDHWLADWEALENTALYTDGDYASLFQSTDLMVTDGISFLGEYPILTGKPTIFLEKPGHWEFSPLGKLAADANIRVTNFDGFEHVFEEIRTVGMPDYSEAIAKLRRAASPYPGKASKQIAQVVAEDFAAKTPLVDPSLVKTLAWEFRAGREPQID